MKTKFFLSSAVLVLALLNQSCKKDYECHCEKKAGGETHIDVKAKKSDADAECNKLAEGSSEYSKCEVE